MARQRTRVRACAAPRAVPERVDEARAIATRQTGHNNERIAEGRTMYVEHYEKLGAEHRDAVMQHLTSLDKHSRTLRFGTSARDEAVSDYVTTIDFERDIVEGVWDNKTLAGVAHLAVYSSQGHRVGELGISVSKDARHRHIGKRLLARALVHARLLQLTKVYVHYITRNRAMARLAREFTDVIEVDRGEATATISLDAASVAQAAA